MEVRPWQAHWQSSIRYLNPSVTRWMCLTIVIEDSDSDLDSNKAKRVKIIDFDFNFNWTGKAKKVRTMRYPPIDDQSE